MEVPRNGFYSKTQTPSRNGLYSSRQNCVKNPKEIDFEFTSQVTPHQKYVVEWVFDTLYSWMRTMMSHMGLHWNLKTGLCPKYAATVTKPEIIMADLQKVKCAYEEFYGNIPDYAKYFKTFG